MKKALEDMTPDELEAHRKKLEESVKELASINYIRGLEYFNRMKYSEAIEQYEQAVHLDRKNTKYQEALEEARKLSEQ